MGQLLVTGGVIRTTAHVVVTCGALWAPDRRSACWEKFPRSNAPNVET